MRLSNRSSFNLFFAVSADALAVCHCLIWIVAALAAAITWALTRHEPATPLKLLGVIAGIVLYYVWSDRGSAVRWASMLGGLVLGVSESRVCQMHTQAVARLRAKLKVGKDERTRH